MKKFLSLVLALVMTMSLVTVAGAKDFTDADKVNYDEAVDVISALEIVGGYADGSFNPKGTLTRGAAAKIICNILVGPETAGELVANTAPYSDVSVDHTFAGYIAYCANEGIISGYADGTFRPAATLTGYAFMKMLLGAVGYDAAIEGYTGTNWAINVAQGVVDADLAKGLDGKFNGNKALTREEACLYAFNALKAQMVEYKDKGDNLVIGDISINLGASEAEKQWDKTDDPTQLYEKKFEDLKLDKDVKADALGRPAHAWKLDKDEIGTYADTATLVLEGYYSEDDLADALDDADLKIAVDEDDKDLFSITTKNGWVVEIFEDEDDGVIEAAEVVTIKTVVKDYADITLGKDKVSTKDEDERSITISGLASKIVADTDVKANKSGYELDNFDALYEAVEDNKDDKDLKVLVTLTTAEKAYSIEILEIVEASISRVNKNDKFIVADGEQYTAIDDVLTGAKVSKDDVKLYVAEDGMVYAIAGISAGVSDIIFVDYVASEEDKWGDTTWTAQIVNEDEEIVDVVLANDQNGDETDETAETMKALARKFYTYKVEDDEYILKAVTKDYKSVSAMDEDKSYVTYTYADETTEKVYFADDMIVVYVGESKADLEVTVKEGVQDKLAAADLYVKNDDGDLAIVYVLGTYDDGESDDVIFVADTTPDADVIDLDGGEAKEYEVYVDGAPEYVMIKEAKAGFWTYDIDEKTGVYELKNAKGVNDASVTITKDTYVSYKGLNANNESIDLDDFVVTGEIVDLTEEGLTTLAAIADWDGKAINVSFLYDADDAEITALYVDFA